MGVGNIGLGHSCRTVLRRLIVDSDIDLIVPRLSSHLMGQSSYLLTCHIGAGTVIDRHLGGVGVRKTGSVDADHPDLQFNIRPVGTLLLSENETPLYYICSNIDDSLILLIEVAKRRDAQLRMTVFEVVVGSSLNIGIDGSGAGKGQCCQCRDQQQRYKGVALHVTQLNW